MIRLLTQLAFLMTVVTTQAGAGPVGYLITVTTAYATSDPFPNRIDHAFTEPDTGYLQIANTGDTSFTGVVGTIAVSVFAGNLSFTSTRLTLVHGASVSIAIPDDSGNVGGFNGPAYFLRPGVEVTLNGSISNGPLTESVALLVADADIHSGVKRTDSRGLTSDSFVLQGGDPWGFDAGHAFELSQAYGVYVFSEQVPEPGSAALLFPGIIAAAGCSRLQRRYRHRHQLRPTQYPERQRNSRSFQRQRAVQVVDTGHHRTVERHHDIARV
jgi:hypothetical protein